MSPEVVAARTMKILHGYAWTNKSVVFGFASSRIAPMTRRAWLYLKLQDHWNGFRPVLA